MERGVMKHLIEKIDWEEVKSFIEVEKRALLSSDLVEDEDCFLSNEEQDLILAYLPKILDPLWEFFAKYPSLVALFEKEFVEFAKFYCSEYISEITLLGGFLFTEQEIFPLGNEQHSVEEKNLEEYVTFFAEWIERIEKQHLLTKEFIADQLKVTHAIKDLDCSCQECIAEYRTKIRNLAYDQGVELIQEFGVDIANAVEREAIKECVDLVYELKQQLRNVTKYLRNKLKRSSISKLEAELKQELNDLLCYPAPLAQKYAQLLVENFKEVLRLENIRRDLVTDVQYERFFTQLRTNLWRNKNYLDREFKKLLKSVLLLKRQDISSKILVEYLGEFWLHSNARQIKRKIIYHAGPTNSGKTYHAIEALSKVAKGCYLAPLRLLAGELFDTLNQKGVKTSLLTGEEVIDIPDATHYSSTIEMARFDEIFDCCVIDEIQMLTDPQRGWAWTRALVNIFAPEIHVCGDASVLDLVKQIVELTGDELEVKYYERMTPLEVEDRKIKLGELEKGDAVIVFSRRNALKYKRDLEHLGFKVSIVYGRLSPEVRREQARKFDKEETDVIVSTDAISMGMNLPIRRIVFSTLSKFINSKEYKISKSEIKQIAGRAGRFGRFPTGYVTALTRVEDGLEQIKEAMGAELEQKEVAMVGPDLDIFRQVNDALSNQGLPTLSLPEFLRLFNTMDFKKPFCCVNLSEMIELAEMVEEADSKGNMSDSEIFGFTCAPVNLGLMDHVQYYISLLRSFAFNRNARNELIDATSNDIDYLETSIKCVELYQWLSRHFNKKNFEHDEEQLLKNKLEAIEKLNELLSKKIIRTCSSCGTKLDDSHKFNICESCFKDRRFAYKRRNSQRNGGQKRKTYSAKKSGGSKKRKHSKANNKSKSFKYQKRTKK